MEEWREISKEGGKSIKEERAKKEKRKEGKCWGKKFRTNTDFL